MTLSPPYIFQNNIEKTEKLFDYAANDPFFEKILHDLYDFGCDIGFSLFGGGGLYVPHALSTEKLDTPEKQQAFARGFGMMVENGQLKAKIKFCARFGANVNAHYFLHEVMHFYQDMHGLYLTPLHEKGTSPIMLDARGHVVITLFCEAWAQTEAIRTSWALKEKGDARGWNGALKSLDWRKLALAYDADLQAGADEARAAHNSFERWYRGGHRKFYERQALKLYEELIERFEIKEMRAENLRTLELPMLFPRLPKNDTPKFFNHIDWANDLYQSITDAKVLKKIEEIERRVGKADNPNIQEIRCGSPPYLWNRLRGGPDTVDERQIMAAGQNLDLENQ